MRRKTILVVSIMMMVAALLIFGGCADNEEETSKYLAAGGSVTGGSVIGGSRPLLLATAFRYRRFATSCRYFRNTGRIGGEIISSLISSGAKNRTSSSSSG